MVGQKGTHSGNAGGSDGGCGRVLVAEPVQGGGAGDTRAQHVAEGVGQTSCTSAQMTGLEESTAMVAAACGHASKLGMRRDPVRPSHTAGQMCSEPLPASSTRCCPATIQSLPLKLIRRICTLLPTRDVVNLSLALPSRSAGMTAHAPTAWAGEWAQELDCPLYLDPTWRLLRAGTVRRVLLVVPDECVCAVVEGSQQGCSIGGGGSEAGSGKGTRGGGGGGQGGSLLEMLLEKAKTGALVDSSLSRLQDFHRHLPYIQELRTVQYHGCGKPIFAPIPPWFPLSALSSSLTYLECAIEQITHSHILALPSLTTLVLSMAGNDHVCFGKTGPLGFASIMAKFRKRYSRLMVAAGTLSSLRKLQVHVRRFEFVLLLRPDHYPPTVTPFASLRVLHISSVVTGDEEISLELSQFARLPSLESLSVEAYYLAPPDCPFARLAALTEFKASLEHGGCLHLPLFPQLRSFDLTLDDDTLPSGLHLTGGIRDLTHLTSFSCTGIKGIKGVPQDALSGLRDLQKLDIIVGQFVPPPNVSLVSLLTQLTRLSLTETFGILKLRKGALCGLVLLKELRLADVIVPEVISDIRRLPELDDVVLHGYMKKPLEVDGIPHMQFLAAAQRLSEPFLSAAQATVAARAAAGAVDTPWEAHEYVLQCGDMSKVQAFGVTLKDGPDAPPLVLRGKLASCLYLHLRAARVDVASWAAGAPNALTLTLLCATADTIAGPPPGCFSRLRHCLVGGKAATSMSADWFALPHLLTMRVSMGASFRRLPQLPLRLQCVLAARAVIRRDVAAAGCRPDVEKSSEDGQQPGSTGGDQPGVRLRRLTLECPGLVQIPSSLSLLTMLEEIYVPQHLTNSTTLKCLPASIGILEP